MGHCSNHVEHVDRIGVDTAWPLPARPVPRRLADVSCGSVKFVNRVNDYRLLSSAGILW
jgi:hypothetical protein